MSLYKRGDVWWYDFTIKGERFRGSTFQTLKSAAAREEGRERDRAAASVGGVPRRTPTLQEAADAWFASRAQDRRSAETIAHRLKILRRHVDMALPVDQIGTPDVEAALQSRRLEETHNGRAPTNSTVNRDIIDTTLRPILNYCADILEHDVRKIAWKRVRLKEPKLRNRPFTAEEILAWRAALPAWHRPLFDFMALYGVRLQEAFFHPDRVLADEGRIFIPGDERKNGVDLDLPLLNGDIPARAARAKAANLETVWFKDTKGVLTPIHWRAFQSASKAAQLSVGIDDARPCHDLRHHAASAASRAGGLTVAQLLLGHADFHSTARYAHADRADVAKALRHTTATAAATEPKSSTESKTGTDT